MFDCSALKWWIDMKSCWILACIKSGYPDIFLCFIFNRVLRSCPRFQFSFMFICLKNRSLFLWTDTDRGYVFRFYSLKYCKMMYFRLVWAPKWWNFTFTIWRRRYKSTEASGRNDGKFVHPPGPEECRKFLIFKRHNTDQYVVPRFYPCK